jgi:hypothetical protein
MFFGARINFDKNNSDFPRFTLSVWQGEKRLFYIIAIIPQNTLDVIYRQGGIIFKPQELGFVDKDFEDAILQWCIRETEQRLRDGRFDETPANTVVEINVTADDVPSIMFFRREKSCDYQRPIGRGLFCSAASPEDASVTAQEGPIRLAPTTRPLCRGCDLPATDLVCSHLAHPTVNPVPNLPAGRVARRFTASGYCELGKDLHGAGANCRAGGNGCWSREIEVAPDLSSVPFSPRELPVALDFLNVMWDRAFKQPLFAKATFQKPAALSLPCGNRDEFSARVGDLNELLRKMDVPDELLPDDSKPSGKAPIKQAEKLNRLSACLRGKLSPDEQEQVALAMDILKAMNVVRNKIAHGGAELIDALRYLGIRYPISDYSDSWDRIRSKAAEALTIVRTSVETLT